LLSRLLPPPHLTTTDTTTRQVGGAIGVALIGSLRASRYGGHVDSGLAGTELPRNVLDRIGGNIRGRGPDRSTTPSTAIETHAPRSPPGPGQDLSCKSVEHALEGEALVGVEGLEHVGDGHGLLAAAGRGDRGGAERSWGARPR
jgi:hypothetical protein